MYWLFRNIFLFTDIFIGLKILFDDCNVSSDIEVERPKLTDLLYFTYDDFDGHPISRDVLVMLWLRLLEAVIHTFSSRIYVDLKLKYQVRMHVCYLKIAKLQRIKSINTFIYIINCKYLYCFLENEIFKFSSSCYLTQHFLFLKTIYHGLFVIWVVEVTKRVIIIT